MKRVYIPFLVVLFCLCIPTIAFSQEKRSSTETYLQELHDQGKERVIVTFKEEIDLSLIEQYNGAVIRPLKIINGAICEIPSENIELLKEEDEVKNVAIDGLVRAQPGSEKRDTEDFVKFLHFKNEYFKRIRKEYHSAIEEAEQEYLKALEEYETGYGSYTDYEQALAKYNKKVALAKDAYIKATSEWEEKVDEMMILEYGGEVEVRWNNLEAGLNTEAAWDNYNLDGTGIKIAFLDTGVNYTLENLDDNYLGGEDYVEDDGDPLTTDVDESHGTKVVSLAVGEGVSKIVGVAYNASYYVVKVLDADAAGTVGDTISGIEWASTEPHKADIISMSLGGYDPMPPLLKEVFEEACNDAYSQGIVLVAASGNEGYSYSSYPAAFANVISAGAYAEDQTLYDYGRHSTNGGVDIVAPGARVLTVKPNNSTWWVWGTSNAAPHVAALIALQLQYARQNNIEPNNGYLWEVMKHSAWPLTGETYDPIWQGNGKIWAAETNPPPGTPHDGSIDCIVAEWPVDYEFAYANYLYLDGNGYPVYFIGTSMYQDVTLTNNTDTVGNYTSDIEELNVTTTQTYYQHDGEVNMPGSPIEVFPTKAIDAGDLPEILEDTYYLPWSTIPGDSRTILDMEFEFVGDPNNRLIKVTYPYASLWCPPPAVNEGFPIED